MTTGQRIANWLESCWVTPAYSGWLIGGLAIFFFMAATNTLAGWLYVISGLSFALLAVAAVAPVRSLREIHITRQPIQPVSVGEQLTIELSIQNQTSQPKTLLQIQDWIPAAMGQRLGGVIENIPAHDAISWTYTLAAERRGIFRWRTVQLRTAASLGLFWCRRSREVPATAVVYPTVLPLTHCPLIDETGQKLSPRQSSGDRAQVTTAGLTRSLRPYRWGDPTRLVHWRSSARYGELRVRELEVFTEGQEVLICLDSAAPWHQDDFEQAVIAAASLYFYAHRHSRPIQLWTAKTGIVQGHQSVLEMLAQVNADETPPAGQPPNRPLIWLSQSPTSLRFLPLGSCWLLWPGEPRGTPVSLQNQSQPGLIIQPDQPLQLQLQSSPAKYKY